MADLGLEEQEQEEEEKAEENPLKVSRRLIYLHRLVGDDVTTPRTKTSRPNPWRVTLTFVFYAFCSTISIITYLDIAALGMCNLAVEDSIRRSPWGYTEGKHLYFEDITQASEILTYLTNGLLPQMLLGGSELATGNAIATFNLVTTAMGFCPGTQNDLSVIFLTMRRVKTTTESEKTTTSRFAPLYPETWKANAIPHDSQFDDLSDNEDTSTLWREYKYDAEKDRASTAEGRVYGIKPSHLGYTVSGGTNITNRTVLAADPQPNVWTKWEYSTACDPSQCGEISGYEGKGGYVAALVVTKTEEQSKLVQDMQANGEIYWTQLAETARNQYVYLLTDQKSTDAQLIIDNQTGTCAPGVRATNIMRFEDFQDAGYIDTQTASVSIVFSTYNPNKQAITSANLLFDSTSVGVLHGPKVVTLDTIKLDLDSTYYLHWEMFYIFGTVFYFIELFVYKGYKHKTKLLRDIWTYVNTVSIICSCISIGMRFHYSSLNHEFLKGSQSEDTSETALRGLKIAAASYTTFSGIALLTIWLRVVELLAETPPRVKLLEATLIKAMGNMVIYFGYISVIMVGFFAFAAVHFCAVSLNFVNPFAAMISTFELLCMHLTPYASTTQAKLRQYFFVPYMMFAIISVQMFNSIINYAYNRVSEDMEPVFKKAAREKAHKEKTSRERKSLRQRCQWCLKFCTRKKETTNEAFKEQKQQSNGDKPVSAEELQPTEKERLDKYDAGMQKKQASESGMAFLLYAIFAVSYFMFLWLALDVQKNGSIAASVASSVADATYQSVQASGAIENRGFERITNLEQLGHWMTHGLPQVLFENSQQATGGFQGNRTQCLHNWNCFVVLPASDPLQPGPLGQSGQTVNVEKMVRVTQRLQRKVDNTGLVDMDPETPLKEPRFALGQMFGAKRGPAGALQANGDNEGSENRDEKPFKANGGTFKDNLSIPHNATYPLRTFCKREGIGQGGYNDKGGIVCLLDAEKDNMERQLHAMSTQGFYSVNTGLIIVDAVLYNANSNCLVYMLLTFTLYPSGEVGSYKKIDSFSLLDVEEGQVDPGIGDRLLNYISNVFKVSFFCGIIYAALTVYFVYRLAQDLKMDVHRKFVNENKGLLRTTYEFFAYDVFHLLDSLSYLISFISLVLFCIWLSQQLDMKQKINDFPTFATYVGGLAQNSRLYAVLSSANLLIVFVRPLKYLRNDPRMAKINMTFAHAMEDITWFTIMLLFFFAGFVLFSYLSFGMRLRSYMQILDASVSCFLILIGEFDFWQLSSVKSWAAILFIFSFLFLFKFFFLNVFFAIIDKFFVTGEPPPLNLKRTLKPMFSRLIRWIEWDDDYTMGGGNDQEQKEGPPSRSGKVHLQVMKIQEIKNADFGGTDPHIEGHYADQPFLRTRKLPESLSDVCDVDEKMNEVLRWARDEARAFVENYRKLQVQKQEFRNDDVFLKSKVKVQIDRDLKASKDEMMTAERHQRYAILVNEAMECRDQETLSKYILRLEDKITKKMIEKHALLTDVYHLRAESEKMRYSDEDMKRIVDEETAVVQDDDEGETPGHALENGQAAAQDEEKAAEDSDEEYAQPEAPPAKPGQGGNGTNGTTLALM